MATLITVDGESSEVQATELAEMQALVGGYIETVTFPDGSLMICNEEGKNNELPRNNVATEIFRMKQRGTQDWIAGDAIFYSRAENEKMQEE
jgi:hypothetical protein